MIEAVNAAVSNAQLVRVVAEQTSTTQSFSSNPTRVQAAAVTAPYLSPHVDLNGGNSKPIFVVRDLSTGEHIRQFPTEGQIRAYQNAKAAAQAQLQTMQSRAESSYSQVAENAAESADLVKSSVEFRQARQAVKSHQEQAIPGAHKQAVKLAGSTGDAAPEQRATSIDTKA